MRTPAMQKRPQPLPAPAVSEAEGLVRTRQPQPASAGRATPMSDNTRLPITTPSFLRQVWALTKPYWFSEERWAARGLLVAVITLNLGLVAITVLINKWNNDFFNALQNKDSSAFSHQMMMWLVLAAVYLAGAV